MAKKLEKVVEEVKAVEVEIIAKVKSAFHSVFTGFGRVDFTDGKAVVSADNKDLINELKDLNVVEEVKPITPAPAAEAPQEDAK